MLKTKKNNTSTKRNTENSHMQLSDYDPLSEIWDIAIPLSLCSLEDEF